MSEPFLGEIRLFSFGVIPKGWAACNGQFLPINQNQALFSILGTTYGGNGQTTFRLPDLRGRTPEGVGLLALGAVGDSTAAAAASTSLVTHVTAGRGIGVTEQSATLAETGPSAATLDVNYCIALQGIFPSQT